MRIRKAIEALRFARAFGMGDPVGSVTFNLRFPGQYYDAATKQHYNLNRYYNPELGRYMEPDPIGLEGGLNQYAYAGGNPVMNVDPSGLMTAMSDSALSNSIAYNMQNQILNLQINNANRSFEASLSQGVKYNALKDVSSSSTAFRPYSIYSSPIAAGMAAIIYSNPMSIRENIEYGGLLYKNDSASQYMFNSPVSGQGASVNPLYSYNYIPGWSVIGSYHTHAAYDPSLGNGNFNFSQPDRVKTFGLFPLRFLGVPNGDIKYMYEDWNYQYNLTKGMIDRRFKK